MTIRTVLKMGNRQLATPAIAVTDFNDPQLNSIVTDMHETMQIEGGVGIAAPQIGYNMRIILFGFESNARYPNAKPIPLTLLINPSIEVLNEELLTGWEGCLSVPGLRGLVPRYKGIRYHGYDLSGQIISREVEYFHARVVQHECDHLDGILFPQRVKDLRFFGFEDELKDVMSPAKKKAD